MGAGSNERLAYSYLIVSFLLRINNMKNYSELNLGFTDAVNYKKNENKELLNKFFLRCPQLDEVLESSKYFLIGEKGTGKTAFSVYLANNDYKQTSSSLNFIGETEYTKFISLKEQHHLSLSDYSSIWKVLLLLLVSQHLKKGEDWASFLNNYLGYKALEETIEEFYNSAFSPEIINAFTFVENSEVAAGLLSKNLKLDGKFSEKCESKESKFQINLLQIEQSFKDILRKLKLRKNHILFIDGIDIRPRGIEYEKYLECIKGLAQATWALNADFFGSIKGSKGRLKIVLLLRPDIFTHLGLQNLNNKLHDNSVLLDWKTTYPAYRASPIFQLIDKILSVQQDEQHEVGECWDYYFPFTNEDADGEYGVRPSFVSFLRFSMSRPRDIISLMQTIREYAKRNNPDVKTISLEDFDNPEFRIAHSQYMLGEIKDYLAFYHTDEDYSLFLKFFEFLEGKAKFSYDDYLDAYNKFADYIERNDLTPPAFFANDSDFLQFLYDMDVICYIQELSDGEKHIHWSYRERNYSNVSPKVQEGRTYSIHYGLRKLFDTGKRHAKHREITIKKSHV